MDYYYEKYKEKMIQNGLAKDVMDYNEFKHSKERIIEKRKAFGLTYGSKLK